MNRCHAGYPVKKADELLAALNDVMTVVEEVNGLLNQISNSSEDQNLRITGINKGLQETNNVVQQDSQISNQTVSASEQLNQLADKLNSIMGRFTLVS